MCDKDREHAPYAPPTWQEGNVAAQLKHCQRYLRHLAGCATKDIVNVVVNLLQVSKASAGVGVSAPPGAAAHKACQLTTKLTGALGHC